MKEKAPTAIQGTKATFPSTQWSNVLALRGDTSECQLKALNSLCRAYWFPLYAFARHRGQSSHDAEEAVQSFFASTGDASFFQQADAERGRLRTFILTAFSRHLTDDYRKRMAVKRGGNVEFVSINHAEVEDWLSQDAVNNCDQEGGEMLQFERHWAMTTLRHAIDKLREEVGDDPKEQLRFKVLSRFLNPATCVDYTMAQAANDLEMTPSGCFKLIQRLRQAFRRQVKDVVTRTLAEPTEATVLNEMRSLQKAMASVDTTSLE